MTSYTPEGVAELNREFESIFQEQIDSLTLFSSHKFNSDKAKEHAQYGYLRRTNTLLRAVELVFGLLPPDLETIPKDNIVRDATIAIHSFVVNTFGALDNLAWILVFERNVLGNNGQPLHHKKVSLASPYIRKKCSAEFCKYLESREDWNRGMRKFRDSLAHQIPLYIPPFTITHSKRAEYERLEYERSDALYKTKNHVEYRRLTDEQNNLGMFHPVMVRSVDEKDGAVNFHPQLISDFRTVHECGNEVLKELGRSATTTSQGTDIPASQHP